MGIPMPAMAISAIPPDRYKSFSNTAESKEKIPGKVLANYTLRICGGVSISRQKLILEDAIICNCQELVLHCADESGPLNGQAFLLNLPPRGSCPNTDI